MEEKYTIDDLIIQKIIFAGNYIQAKTIAKELRKHHIKTDVIEQMVVIRDPKFYMLVDHGELTMIMGYSISLFRNDYIIIDCNDIDIEFPSLDKEDREFELNEVVHAVINNQSVENMLFNIYGSCHVTAMITAIDKENKMCEVTYLHNGHRSVWLEFEDIHHIEHVYDECKELEYIHHIEHVYDECEELEDEEED